MKRGSPARIVLITAVLISIFVFLLQLSSYYIIQLRHPLYYLLLVPLITLIVAFAINFFAVKRFIYDRIRVIYKIIHDIRSGSREFTEEQMHSDVLEKTRQDVMILANSRRTEIEQLQQLANYRKEFLGNVSHELKTPVMSILGYLDTLLDGGIHDERINRLYVEKALRNTERLSEIINDLESISKLESGEFELKKTKFDVTNLLNEVFESLEMQAENAKISLVLHRDSDRPQMVYADKKLIREVLVNLITNAIKYGREDGKVEAGIYLMDNEIFIEIADDGPGISEENLNRIFERFFRVEKSRNRETGGTGLGLAIVKHILEAHGQSISVSSREGEGSVFRFALERN